MSTTNNTNKKRRLLSSFKTSKEKRKLPSFYLKSSNNQTNYNTKNSIPLFKKSTGPVRTYVGHFQGTIPPTFKGSEVKSFREECLQTQIERIENDDYYSNKKNKREEKLKQLKFEKIDKDSRDFWFEFKEPKPLKKTDKKHDNSKGRTYLGKPKAIDKSNFEYCIFEVDELNKVAYVYPTEVIEFTNQTQLIEASGMSAKDLKARYDKKVRQRLKNIKQTEHRTLDILFGTGINESSPNSKNDKSKLKGNELSMEAKLIINDNDNDDDKKISKRLRRTRERGNMDDGNELEDHDDHSDESGEEGITRDTNFGTYDDSESEFDSDIEGGDNDGDKSEDDPEFQKLNNISQQDDKKINEAIDRKKQEYDEKQKLKEKLEKNKLNEGKDDDDDDDNNYDWARITDDEDEDDDDYMDNRANGNRPSKRPLEDDNIPSNLPNKRRKLNKTSSSLFSNELISKDDVITVFRKNKSKEWLTTTDLFQKVQLLKVIDQQKMQQAKKAFMIILKQIGHHKRASVEGSKKQKLLWKLKDEFKF